MKEYPFQYTKTGVNVFVLLGCMLACLVLVEAGAFSRVPEGVVIVLAPALAIALFYRVKRYAVRHGTAQLGDTRLVLNLEDTHKCLDFQDLVSFRSYNKRNVTFLHLNTAVDRFTLSANNNYCDSEAFESFCAAVIAHLDHYQEKDN